MAQNPWWHAGRNSQVANASNPSRKGADVTSYQVGKHVVRISSSNGRWAVVVDDAALTKWFVNQAEAWAAGVQEADRLDRQQAVPR